MMELSTGKVLKEVSVDVYTKFLDERNLKTYISHPGNLKVTDDGRKLVLQLFDYNEVIPVRKSFLFKLLRWFRFPVNQLQYLNTETVAAICNDYLLSIISPKVNVVIENSEALTITSMKYSSFSDIDILKLIKGMKVDKISRDDFVTRFYFNEKFDTEPVPGDKAGFGFNILNSETGFMQLCYVNYILRYTCSNGMIVKLNDKNSGIYHYDTDPAMFREYIMKQMERTKYINKKLVDQVRLSAESKLDKKIRSIQQQLDRITGRSPRIDIAGLLDDDKSLYDAINLITNNAKRFEPYVRLQLENFAGSLLISNN